MSSPESQVTTLDEAPAPVSSTKAAVKGKGAIIPAVQVEDGKEAPKMFNVTVHATGDDAGNDAVDIQPNGRLYRLPRGVPCLVPHEVLHILENAVTTTYKVVGADVIERHIPRFPFSATPA